MDAGSSAAKSWRDVLVTAGLLALFAGGIAAARGYSYHEPLERDITLYAEIGRELLAGRALYSDLWDHKPPGIHVTYALAQGAVGPGLPAVYLLAVGAAWLGLLAVYAAGRAGGGRGAGLLAAGLWALVCGDLYLQANQPNTEVFINAWAAIGFALILAAPARARVDGVRFVAVGAAFAAASLFKPVILAVAAGLALAHVLRPPAGASGRRHRLTEVGVAAAVGAGAWALVTTYFALTDRLSDFVSAMWTYNRFHAGDTFSNLLVALRPRILLPGALHFALPLFALVGAGLCWEATRGAARRWWLYAGYATGVFVAVAAPGKFFPHYYQLWLPLIAIGPAWIVSALWRTRRTPAVALGTAVLAFAAWHVLPQYSLSLEEWSRRKYGEEIAIETHDLARQIDALLPEDETLFHWGNDSGFYFTSGRRPSTGILFVKPLVKGPLTHELSRRTLAQLQRDPPAFLVARIKWLAMTPPHHPVLAWLMSRYVPFEGDLDSENFAFFVRADAETESPPEALSDTPAPVAWGVDAKELDRLRSLGYAGVGDALAPDAPTGVLRFDVERAAPGLNLMTHSHFCTTQLVDLYGKVRHAWSYQPCGRWGNAILLPDGDLLLLGRDPHEKSFEANRSARYVMRMAWDGSVRWKRTLPVHHDVDLTPDGRIVSLTYGHRLIPKIDPEVPTRDHSVVVLTPTGEVVEEISFWKLLTSAPEIFQLHRVPLRLDAETREIDIFHSNSIEWMRREALIGRSPFYRKQGVLVCLRSQNSVAIIDWETKQLVWAWGKSELSAPHDATLLENGNILIFDNGHGRGWSRVVEVDPHEGAIVWEYRAPDPGSFFTKTRGAAQRLENGNTLITESEQGRVFEVTAEGEIVWEFQTPMLTPSRQPSVIVRARRLEGLSFRQLEAMLTSATGQVPRVD